MRKLFEKACCFAGPESIPEEQEHRIIARINHVMDRLISKEIFQFYTGAATGFDLLAARAVLERKQSDSRVRLFLQLACPMQSQWYPPREQFCHEMIEEEADGVDLLSCYQSLASILGGRRSIIQQCNVCVCYGQIDAEDAAFLKKRAEEYCLKLIYLVDRPPKRRVNCVLLHTDPNDLPKKAAIPVKRCENAPQG